MPSRIIVRVKTSDKAPSKHQLKSEATRNALLEAALTVFARNGYERAQIDEIAKLSGRTRGAVYSQYKTKEQLFFALQEHCMRVTAEKVRLAVAQHPQEVNQSLSELKDLFAALDDQDTAILDLELKLYAVRNPECREGWRKRYSEIYSVDNSREFQRAFGVVEEQGRPRIRNRTLALSAIRSGLILAMQFMPEALNKAETKMLLREVFDGLFPPGLPQPSPKGDLTPASLRPPRSKRKPTIKAEKP